MAGEVAQPSEWALERLEAEICQGAAHLFAGMARWLALVAEFDRREGYARWECRSTAYWLNWHCSISLRTGHEHVRVARALLELPATAAAFSRGELSYSKVRAITRVATPATEAQLLEWAPHATAAHMERIAAGRRRVDRQQAAESHNARHFSFCYDDDGSLVGNFRLDPDEGAAVLAAITLGRDLLRKQRSAERKAAAQRSAEHIEADPERSAEHTEASGERYAERSLDDCSPEPLRTTVANADALALMVETMLAADHSSPISRHERTMVMLHISAENGQAHLHDGPSVTTDTAHRMACDAVVSALFRNGSEVLDLGRTQRLPNRAQRRALMARDGGCRFPGCTERRYVEAHHVVHWMDGGPTDLSNLLLLCWPHHRAVHEGGCTMALSGGAVSVWRSDGSLLESEALVVPEGPGIVEHNEALGLKITPDSVTCEWDGRKMSYADYSDAVEGLLWLEDRYRREVEALQDA